MASPALRPRIFSLYRSLLRELPTPSSALLSTSTRSPLHQSLRSDFKNLAESSISQAQTSAPRAKEATALEKVQVGEQFVTYLKAQRMYTTLIDRYNPGLNMDEEERIRLTARRVGVELPTEFDAGKKD